MSTPEEKLRQLAAQLEAEREAQAKRDKEQASQTRQSLTERVDVARQEALDWRDRAEALVTATGKRIPFAMKVSRADPGFEITVGASTIGFDLRLDGWHVVKSVPPDLHPKGNLPTDAPQIRDDLLHRMVEQGLRDLYAGKITPETDTYGRT